MSERGYDLLRPPEPRDAARAESLGMTMGEFLAYKNRLRRDYAEEFRSKRRYLGVIREGMVAP